MIMNEVKLLCSNINKFEHFVKLISTILKPNDLVLLEGLIGVGKTQFVKFYCKYIGCDQTVTSPSYTLVNMYNIQNYNIVHADLYRIEDENELLEMGIEDYLINNITFIEWGEKFQDFFSEYLIIKIEHLKEDDYPSGRKIMVSYKGNYWETKLKNIKNILESNKITVI